jgi:hypothetical protein
MHALVITGQWVTGIGTTLDDTVDSIALDPSTNIYAVGTTYATASTDLFYVSSLYDTEDAGLICASSASICVTSGSHLRHLSPIANCSPRLRRYVQIVAPR